MSLVIEYDGEDVTGLIRLEGGVQGLVSAADGQFESAAVKIDDEAGTRVITPWQLMTADETDCDLPRIWTGYLFQEDADRGLQPHSGPSRDYLGQLSDLNILLHMQPARGADAKRPVETGNDRIAWLLASVAMAAVYDGGLIGDNPNLFDAADYNDPPAYADEILQDLCVSSSDDEPGRIFCVLWDQDDERPVLFMDVPTAAVYESDLSISNDLADVDPFGPTAEVFYPHPDAQLTGQGNDIYCSVFFIYKTGRFYLHNQDTHDEFFGHDSINHRQAVYSTSRVGSLETAERHAAQFLANHNGKKDTIVCRVILPKEQVNKLDVAMRVQVKFTHFRGFEDFTWTRVQRRTVLLNSNPARTDQYEVLLELSTKGFLEGAGGPPPTDFPAPPAGPPAIVQSKFGRIALDGNPVGGIRLDLPPTEGNWLIAGIASRGVGITLDNSNGTWSEHPHGQITPGSDYGRLVYREIGPGESQDVIISSIGGTRAEVWEVSGIDGTLDASSFADTDTFVQPASIDAGTITPTPAVPAIMFMLLVMHCSDWAGNGPTTMSTPSGWTTDGEWEVTVNGDAHPNVQANSLITTSTTGSYGTSSTIAGAGFNFGGWGGLALVFAGTATANPPGSSQLVPWTSVAMTPLGGVSVGTTAFPYAPGSLQVKVDGVLISPASYTETDPNTGDFALAWLLDGDETVIVQYQAL